MSATSAELSALAELLAAGLHPNAALAAMVEAGGEPALWARRLDASARVVGLGPALAQAGVLSRDELRALGGTEVAGRGGALRWIVERRERVHARARACLRALVLPSLWAVLTVVSAQPLAALGGSPVGLWDLSPLALLALMIAGLARWGWPAVLPQPSRLARGPREGEYAARVAAAVRDGLALPAALRAAAPIMPQLPVGLAPRAPAVSTPLALCFVVGGTVGDLADRLDRIAEIQAARVTRWLAWATRFAAWGVVFWISVKLVSGLMGLSVGGLEGLDLGGANSPEMEELMRELGY